MKSDGLAFRRLVLLVRELRSFRAALREIAEVGEPLASAMARVALTRAALTRAALARRNCPSGSKREPAGR
jgi:hypothetical protein